MVLFPESIRRGGGVGRFFLMEKYYDFLTSMTITLLHGIDFWDGVKTIPSFSFTQVWELLLLTVTSEVYPLNVINIVLKRH